MPPPARGSTTFRAVRRPGQFLITRDVDIQRLWILDVDGGDARKLLDFEASTYGGVDWTPDGETLVYGASADGRMQLFSISRDGGRSHQLTTDAANLIQPQISPDGRWIAATRVHRSKELRRMSLQ